MRDSAVLNTWGIVQYWTHEGWWSVEHMRDGVVLNTWSVEHMRDGAVLNTRDGVVLNIWGMVKCWTHEGWVVKVGSRGVSSLVPSWGCSMGTRCYSVPPPWLLAVCYNKGHTITTYCKQSIWKGWDGDKCSLVVRLDVCFCYCFFRNKDLCVIDIDGIQDKCIFMQANVNHIC